MINALLFKILVTSHREKVVPYNYKYDKFSTDKKNFK